MNSSALQDVMTTALVTSLNEAEQGFGDNTLHEELDEVNALIKAQMPWESREALSHQLHFARCADSITLLDEFAFWQGRLHHPEHINQLFLHLLPNETFKRRLTTAFINNYNFTSYSLTLSSESEKL